MKTAITKIPMRLFILSCLSGVLSYLAVALPRYLTTWLDLSDDAFFLFPGLFFGLFVLVPLVEHTIHRALRCAGLLMFSVGAWYVAVAVGFQVLPLVDQLPAVSCGISGSIGVLLLTAASRYLVPMHFKASSFLIALLVGFIGGSIIGMALTQPRTSLAGESLYFIGFLSWHCGVATALFGRERTSASRRSLNAKA
jgi:hypothetical protein